MGRLQQKRRITNLFRVAFLLLKQKTQPKTEAINDYSNMKTKIPIFILAIGLTAFDMAQSAPSAGGSASGGASGSAGSSTGSANGSASGSTGAGASTQPASGTPVQPQPAPGTQVQPIPEPGQPASGTPFQNNNSQNQTIPPQNGATNWNGMNGTTN